MTKDQFFFTYIDEFIFWVKKERAFDINKISKIAEVDRVINHPTNVEDGIGCYFII